MINQIIAPPSKTSRQSGIELLRIVSMLFVVLMHINGFSNLDPRTHDMATINPLFSGSRFLLQSIVIVGVNVFILISGWFSIKANIKGLLKFVFQVVFLYFLVYLILVALGLRPMSASHLLSCLTLGYWFVHAYLILYILSPILNAFTEHASKNTFRNVIIIFLVYQTVYGWIKAVSESIHMGYSPISFIWLYLLARYIRMYGETILKWNSSRFLLIIIGSVLINTCAAFVLSWLGKGDMVELVYYYCNPLLIIQSLCILVLFSRMTFQSRFVNWVAGSCFAVYLIHMHPMVRDYFFEEVSRIWQMPSMGKLTLYFLVLTLAIYIVSILVDKLRIVVWNLVSKRL